MFNRRKQSQHTPEPTNDVERPPGRLKELLISSSILDLSIRGLRGYVPFEGLCYWFGREIEPGLGLVFVTAFPRIYSTERSFQLVEGQMSHLTTWAHQQNLWLLAQVHTHPADEPHSEADESLSPTRREGFLSIVLPFGAQFANLRDPQWRCFECNQHGQWIEGDVAKLRVYTDVWLPER